MNSKIVLGVLSFLLVSVVWADENWVRRAAFDIGSGSTKMVVADVNVATKEIKIIHEQDEKVDYQFSIEKYGNFDEDVKNSGILALAKLKWVALEKGAASFKGVATSAFRKSKNGQEFAQFITKVLGIEVHIISQQQEAILGFLGAVVGENTSIENTVVWDIGGGSMQITAWANDQFVVYEGNVASVTLANYIIKSIQNKESATPNPISKEDAQKAMEYIQSVAVQVPQKIKDKLKLETTSVLGIGGVHYYSVRGQLKMGEVYGHDSLAEAIYHSIGKTDEEIGSKYASTEISNLILVQGFFDALGMKHVKPKKVSMANGFLVYQDLWR